MRALSKSTSVPWLFLGLSFCGAGAVWSPGPGSSTVSATARFPAPMPCPHCVATLGFGPAPHLRNMAWNVVWFEATLLELFFYLEN